MNLRIAIVYAALAVMVGLLCFATGLLVVQLQAAPGAPPSPLKRYGPCEQKVWGATPEYYCPSGPSGRPTAFVHQSDGWQSAGVLSAGSTHPVQ